jgi:hypothetical protein
LAGECVEVDVFCAGPRVGLRKLFGQRVEFSEVGHDLGALAQPERVLPAETLGALPVLPGA